MKAIKVFRNGKNTQMVHTFENGVHKGAITRRGKGYFLERSFSATTEAESFCREILREDRSAIFYVMDGDVIAGTILDQEFHQTKLHRSEWLFSVLSLTAFSFLALCMSVTMFPDHSLLAHFAFSLTVGIAYALLHSFMGKGNFEAAVAMVVFLIFFANVTAFFKSKAPHPQMNQSSDGLKVK